MLNAGYFADRPQFSPPVEYLERGALAAAPDLPAPDGANEAPAAGTIEHVEKAVTGVWVSGEENNLWLALKDVGWRQISDKAASGLQAMAAVAMCAVQDNRRVTAREEAGRIVNLYLW